MNCQAYVSFATDMYVLYQQEKLPFTCSPIDAALSGTLSSITLLENSTSGWKEVVRIWLKTEDRKVIDAITWTNTDIQNRATIKNRLIDPSSQAGLQIEISPSSVKCSDRGAYKCSINGDGGALKSESAPITVRIKGKQKL